MAKPFTGYQRRLFVFLSVATFFEGYDFLALAQILPNLRADMGLSKWDAGLLFAFVNLGTMLAWWLVRKADRWGRRRVMMITIGGYTSFTFLSGLAWDVWSFAAFQFMARFFLIAEWATSNLMAAEEFPAERRGMVVGVIQAFSALGAILCAGTVPFLLNTTYGWRSVYFVGIVPLVILIYARRNLRETRRFTERAGALPERQSPWAIWRTPYRKRLAQLGTIWLLTYACANIAVSFWKEFAVGERGFTDADVGASLTFAALVSMPMIFYAGKLLDVIGRRKGAVFIMLATVVGVYTCYWATHPILLTASLTVAIFGTSSVLPLLNTYTAELFPTELRGAAFGWANNLIGRSGYVLSPILVGWLAEDWGWGAAVRPTVIFPLIALGLLLWWLPETKGRELEDTAAVPS